MNDAVAKELTSMIELASAGDRSACDRLFEVVYDELRTLARSTPYAGQPGHTLQPTVLANEAYLMLADNLPLGPDCPVPRRAMFFRTVALAMRSILREHWREQQALKRGGGQKPAVLQGDAVDVPSGDLELLDFLALDEAMTALEQYNRRWYEVVLHRYFAARSIEETGLLMDVGPTTVKADWKLARAWLRREIAAERE